MSDESSAFDGRRWMIRVAAITGFAGVALGAFGAHGLEKILEANDRADVWDTAVFYHLVHAVVLLVLAIAARSGRSGAFWCFLSGIVVFSGTLYALAVTNAGWLGAITPLGGVLLLAGWLWLAMRARV